MFGIIGFFLEIGMAIVLYASLMAVYVNFVSTELQWMSDQFNDKIEVSIIVQ